MAPTDNNDDEDPSMEDIATILHTVNTVNRQMMITVESLRGIGDADSLYVWLYHLYMQLMLEFNGMQLLVVSIELVCIPTKLT